VISTINSLPDKVLSLIFYQKSYQRWTVPLKTEEARCKQILLLNKKIHNNNYKNPTLHEWIASEQDMHGKTTRRLLVNKT